MKERCKREGFSYKDWLRAGQHGGSGSTMNKQRAMTSKLKFGHELWVNPLQLMPSDTQNSMPASHPKRGPKTKDFLENNHGQKGIHEKENASREEGLPLPSPPSPYLFLLCTEGLVRLLKQSTLDGVLKEIRVNRPAPLINHLFFDDDSLIFYKTNCTHSLQLLNIFQKYAKALGQCVGKKMMIFSKNVQEKENEDIIAL